MYYVYIYIYNVYIYIYIYIYIWPLAVRRRGGGRAEGQPLESSAPTRADR